jgi:hypothetical protein
MNRREFISLLGSAAAAWPLAAPAQQAGKLPTIGFLGAASASAWGPWTAALVQRLHELGWIEGRTVAMEYRWAEGRSERYAEIAAEFVRLKVDVIVTTAPAVPVAKQVTSVVPIVFALAGDPVGAGLVASLARPGGNVTGLSIQQTELAGKRLEILREVVPGLRRLAIMTNIGFPDAVLEMWRHRLDRQNAPPPFGRGRRAPDSSLLRRNQRARPDGNHKPCANCHHDLGWSITNEPTPVHNPFSSSLRAKMCFSSIIQA